LTEYYLYDIINNTVFFILYVSYYKFYILLLSYMVRYYKRINSYYYDIKVNKNKIFGKKLTSEIRKGDVINENICTIRFTS